MKPQTLLTLSVLFLIVSIPAFAQYPGMAAFRQQQNMEFANRQMLSMMQLMGMRGVSGTPVEYDFDVILRDSTKQQITSAMYTDSVTKKHFIVLVDKKYKKSDTNRYKRIYPAQTLYIQRNVATAVGPGLIHNNAKAPPPVYFKGKATDSCWMFKVISGPITAYSYSAEEDDDMMFNPYSIVGIQLNDGPILNFSAENLKEMVGENLDALQFILKKNYYKAIKKFNKETENIAKK
jgi:hypothetical protein